MILPLDRRQALECVLPEVANYDLVIASNGYVSRDVFAATSGADYFYMLGSMGLAATIGLGTVLAQPGARVAVIDGDANLAMGLAALPMVGEFGTNGFTHIVLDNGTNESTGGQPSLLRCVDVASLALACGYKRAATCTSKDEIIDWFRSATSEIGPAMLHITIDQCRTEVGPRVNREPEMIAQSAAELLRARGHRERAC